MKQANLFRMLYLMLYHRKTTAEMMADILGVSPRSVLRYVDELSLAGIPIYSRTGANGGIFLADNLTLPANVFTAEEFRTIEESLLSVQSAGSAEQITRILEKLNALQPRKQANCILRTDMLMIDHTPWGDVPSSNRKLKLCEEAIAKCIPMEIEYHDAHSRKSLRTIEPHMLLLKQGEWYLYAFCRVKQDFRLFKLTRIAGMTFTEPCFARRPFDREHLNFDKFLTERKDFLTVELQFDQSILTDMEEWLSVEKIQPLSGELYYAKVELYPDFTLLSKILSMGKALTVLSPQSLKEELNRELQVLVQIYNEQNEIPKKGL